MKKNWVLFLNILFFFIAILVYAFACLRYAPKGLDILWFVLLEIVGFILGVFCYIAIHETGHLVFGLLSKYKLVSFKFLCCEWYLDQKEQCHFRVIPITSFVLGQCLMQPPKMKKKKLPPFYLYNAGGMIFSYVFTILLVLVTFLLPVRWLVWFFAPQLLISVFMSLNNSLFMKDGYNDFSNAYLVKQNPRYLQAIAYQLEVVSNNLAGKRFGTKCWYQGYYEEKLNHITLPVVQFMFYAAIDHDDLEEAKKLAQVMLDNYQTLPFPIFRLCIIYAVMWCDLVVSQDQVAFRRHYQRIDEPMIKQCKKGISDAGYMYDIYTKIYQKNYQIDSLIDELFESDCYQAGEALSMRKMMDYLVESLKKEEEKHEVL